MHIILRYPARRHVNALLLFASLERMRVVVRSQNDTLELRRIGSQWFSDRGSAVEIELIMTDDPSAVARIWSEARPRFSSASC